ncbi:MULTISPECIES: hypothetical protein [unclassified Streptomyces]|uniref:hypothetical protein n=1 Tax=unclassified Streptomyces TaxID=2593676 RepID=UPI002E807D7D|nr:hypothetical protein [Streptomyces sp. NBC_00562]WUC21688.1 hypothetical protein OHA33_24085 [Streptomyces sp. NBC_00562]
MSQPVPPSNQPQPPSDAQPGGGNPFADQQPGQPGQLGVPTGNPFAGQQPGQPGQFGGVPFTPVAPVRNNVGLGLLAAVVAALVAAGIYGGIIGATKHEIGYAAVGVGFLVGLAAGKVGGRNPVLPVLSAVLALVGVYGGQLLGVAMINKSDSMPLSEVFLDHFSELNSLWKADIDPIAFLFFALAAFAAFSGAKKTAG